MSSPGELKDGEIYLGNYLLDRLAQLGVQPMFGVPGDFNLTFLDLVESHKTINWVGNANELNASYAADGYARVKQAQYSASKGTQGGVRGLACLLTTFGVGELSAVNGIAGAYSERVPILHIVGVPSTKLQHKKALLHHTLGDGQFNTFEIAAKGITAAQSFLRSANGAGEQIDKVLRVALETARPTYLTIPTDLVFAPLPSAPLLTPVIPPSPNLNSPRLPSGKLHEIDDDTLNFVTGEIGRLWNAAKNPCVLIDACAIRYGVTHLVQQFVEKTGVKYFTTPMGKSALSEDAEKGFGGVWVGQISDDEVRDAFLAADLVVVVGSIYSDFNTGEFSSQSRKEITIELHSDHTIVQYARYDDLSFHTLLPALIGTLAPKNVLQTPKSAGQVKIVPEGDKDKMVTQAAFWPLWSEFLQPNDVVIAETGTSSFGSLDMALPSGATFVSQVLWGSIGWAGGATLGCLMAAKEAETKRRTILFTGDGSLQLTVQEISTMLRQNLKPIIVVLNNDGYVIERLIHGPSAVYNDISRWKWQELLSFFNADNIPHRTWLASTRGELETILVDAEFAAADKCQLIEVKLDRLDGPRALVVQAKLSAELNAAVE